MTDDKNFGDNRTAADEPVDSITYDDNWKTVKFTEYPQTFSENTGRDGGDESNKRENVKKTKSSPKQLVIIVQLVLCVIIALAALILSAVGGDAYTAVREWYYNNLNKSAVFEDGSTPDISLLFGDTSDEA